MKTAHQLARELLTGPDLPIWHFDPSRAGIDSDIDTSLSEPDAQENDPLEDMTEEQVAEYKEEGGYAGKFLTISGENDESGEADTKSNAETTRLLREVYRNTNLRFNPELTMLAEVVRKHLKLI